MAADKASLNPKLSTKVVVGIVMVVLLLGVLIVYSQISDMLQQHRRTDAELERQDQKNNEWRKSIEGK